MNNRVKPSLVKNGHPSNPVALITGPKFTGADQAEYLCENTACQGAASATNSNAVISEAALRFEFTNSVFAMYFPQFIFIPPVSIFVITQAAFVLPYP